MNGQPATASMTSVQIEVESRAVWFSLDRGNGRWHCAESLQEAGFPLISVLEGKRYELYSDGTIAEVER